MRIRAGILALAILVVGDAAQADGPEESRVQWLRDKHPPLEREKFDAMMDKRMKGEDWELDGWRESLGRLHAKTLAKWRAIAAVSQQNGLLGRNPNMAPVENVMWVWKREQTRREQLDELAKKEAEERKERFGDHGYLGSDAEKAELEKRYASQRAAVQSQFQKDLQDAQSRAHDPAAANTAYDGIREETILDLALINGSLKKVNAEIARRKGVAEKEREKDEPPPPEDRDRLALHVVPYRTEYEAKTGETVTTLFQVFKGAKPYVVLSVAPSTLEGPQEESLAEPGDLVVPFTFKKAGDHVARVHVRDAQGEDRAVSVTVHVTGPPWKPTPPDIGKDKSEKTDKPGENGKKGNPDTPPTPTRSAPVPIQGTFKAILWGAGTQWDRYDTLGAKTGGGKPGVPFTLTIAADGSLRASVKYAVSPTETQKPSDDQMRNMFWRSSFELDGTVDWKTGRTVISITKGHDERGYEKDVEQTGIPGQKLPPAHWRQHDDAQYSTRLEGWTLPGPEAAAWLAGLSNNPMAAAAVKTMDLEMAGMPGVQFAADGTVSFRNRGFFGMLGIDRSPPPSGVVPRHITYTRLVVHDGYDGANGKDKDERAQWQGIAERQAADRSGSWYLKVLGAADPPEPPEPKRGDLLGFSLWPTKPITAAVGGTFRARAVGVFGSDVFQPVDLTEKATWNASAGLTQVGPGTFTAAAPGTYTITVTHAGTSGGPMTSTIAVIVK
jgi:hypothetical protein